MHRESYTSVQCRDPAEFSVPDLISEEDVGNVCCGQMSSSVIMFEFSFPSRFSSAKANTCYVVGSASVQTTWGTCMGEGTIDVEANIGIVQRHKLPSR